MNNLYTECFMQKNIIHQRIDDYISGLNWYENEINLVKDECRQIELQQRFNCDIINDCHNYKNIIIKRRFIMICFTIFAFLIQLFLCLKFRNLSYVTIVLMLSLTLTLLLGYAFYQRIILTLKSIDDEVASKNSENVRLDDELKELHNKMDDLLKCQDIINKDVDKLKRGLKTAKLFNDKYLYMPCDESLTLISENNNLLELLSGLSQYNNCYKKKNIMTSNENIFYTKIMEFSKKHNFGVIIHTRLLDLIDIGDFANNPKYSKEWIENKINFYSGFLQNKHIDFVIFDAKMSKYLCIELDDSSHFDVTNPYYSKSNIVNHIVKDMILSYCKIPFLRFDNSNIDNLEEIICKGFSKRGVQYEYSNEHKKMFSESIKSICEN